MYRHECSHCRKIFSYWFRLRHDYKAAQAPCLNGGEHEYETSGIVAGLKICKNCGDRIRKKDAPTPH